MSGVVVVVGGGVDRAEPNRRWKMVGEWKSLAHCVNVMKTGRLPRRLFSIECDGRGRGYTVETVIHFDNRLTKKKKKKYK